MKFLFSTINNRSIALLFGVAFCAISAFGQSPFSAYSRFGIGTPARPGSMTHFGMGGVSTPITDGTLINFSNPASYSFCSLTTLQVNATGSSITATSTDASTSYNYGQVNELGMLFKKPGSRWAFAAGLSPYSLINYNFRESENLNDSAKVNKIYNGSGGLNKATIGTSRFFTFYKTIIRKDRLNQKDTTIKVPVHQISVGANVNVLFGTLQRENLAEFQSSTTYNTKQISKLNNKGILFDIGLLYRARLAKKEESGRIIGESHLYVGLDYNMQTKLRSVFNENYTRYVYSNGVAVNGGETYTSEEVIGKMTIPQRISLGVAFNVYPWAWLSEKAPRNGADIQLVQILNIRTGVITLFQLTALFPKRQILMLPLLFLWA